MKNTVLFCFLMIQTSCIIDRGVECEDWERNTLELSSYDFAFEKNCSNILYTYANSFYAWSGDLNIINENGEVYNLQLSELNASILPPNVVKLDYPLNSDDYYQQNEEYPIPLMLDFISPDKLNFIIDSEVYDPFVESIVNYNGTGQIINVNGNISLEFNCEFYHSGISYSVSCNLTHNLKTR